MKKDIGDRDSEYLSEMTRKIYQFGRDNLEAAGIILADTKLEFGYHNDKIILIDEVMTPDSSRFWDGKLYKIGISPVSYDKQFIRDYIDTTEWDKNSPPPPLPDEIITKTYEKYNEILIKIENVFK
jgi:phosphoribosylaminoimidazole-succinocarboxamide synthase